MDEMTVIDLVEEYYHRISKLGNLSPKEVLNAALEATRCEVQRLYDLKKFDSVYYKD
jgi:hypothetical protein